VKGPTVEEFGITDADVKRLAVFKHYVLPKVAGYTTLIGVLILSLWFWSELGLAGIPLGAFAGLVGGFILSCVICLACEAIWILVDRRVRGARKYEEARSLYQHWVVRTQSEFWRSLSGVAFERELARLYRQLGYQVRVTPASGDGGIDLILSQDGRRTVVQCKATRKPVGPEVVRDLYGTLIDSRADDAILASLSGATAGAADFAYGKQIRIIDLAAIIQMQEEAGIQLAANS